MIVACLCMEVVCSVCDYMYMLTGIPPVKTSYTPQYSSQHCEYHVCVFPNPWNQDGLLMRTFCWVPKVWCADCMVDAYMYVVWWVSSWWCHCWHSLHSIIQEDVVWLYCSVRAAQSSGVSVSTFSPSSTNTESSLNVHNLNTALETLPDEEWDDFGVCLNVPDSQLNEIKSQYSTERERKSALLHTYITSHPAPSWQHVADTLYRYDSGKLHAVLERVQTMFPTGKRMCQCCIVLLQESIEQLSGEGAFNHTSI